MKKHSKQRHSMTKNVDKVNAPGTIIELYVIGVPDRWCILSLSTPELFFFAKRQNKWHPIPNLETAIFSNKCKQRKTSC